MNRRITQLALVAALTVIALCVGGTAAADNGNGRNPLRDARPAAGSTAPDRRFGTLDDAIAARALDPKVVTRLRSDGVVEALVTVAYRATLAVAKTDAHGRERAVVARMKQGFGEAKARALDGTSDAKVVRGWEHLPSSLVEFRSEHALLAVLNKPDVVGVSADGRFEAQSASHLDYIGQPQAAQSGNVGDGTYVAVVDTGIDYRTYPDFGTCPQPGVPGCKVAELHEIAADDGVLDSPVWPHGSNVASIVTQVAPGTRIIGYDVFSGDGAFLDDIESALESVIAKRADGQRIVAVNMSLGGGSYTDCSSPWGDPIGGTFAALRAADVLPVVASGNSAANGTFGIGYPACLPDALSVGATYDANVGPKNWRQYGCSDGTTAADVVTCFSQTGPALDVLAPGTEIDGAAHTMTGTSMAAPHVAGAAAVLAAARSDATADQVERALVSTGPAVTDRRFEYVGGTVTRHRIDLAAALESLLDSASATPSLDVRTMRTYAGTLTTTIDYSDICGRYLGQGTYSVPADVFIGPSLTSYFGAEANPFNLLVGETDVASNLAEGSVSLWSAGMYYGGLILQYWKLSFDGTNLTGTLVEDHREEAAAYNLLSASMELVPCQPWMGIYPWQYAMSEGTKLEGTVTADAVDLRITGNVVDGTRAFVTEIRATRG